MKKIFAVMIFAFLMSHCASLPESLNEINQKLDSKAVEEIVLVKVIDDSRCPEGVQCVWAGEVTVEVAAYKNKKLVEQTQFTLNKDHIEEMKYWLIKYLPKRSETLKNISVLPYPKEGMVILPQDYKIVLEY
ncbi:hypothetical protein ABGT15_10065 [Flavobacterium enshiense]|uniref:hypothetical protein n=1 Tax=Flavobacterium enshiense TaxID=1341165 RepID=UPI00345D48DE